MRIAIAKSATVFRHKQLIAMHASLAACVSGPPGPILVIGGGKGGARGLKPPLRMISHRNYLSWSGAENLDKDRDTLIEQSL